MLMRNARRPAPRRGIILMVVVAILAIFAILGVTFVLYSDNEARSARIAREAEDLTRPDMDPELAMSLFLGQLIFGVPDDARGVGSGIRGHDLARDMYGYNPPPPLGTGGNYIPFDGTGNLSYALGPNPPFLNGQDNANLVNYTYFPGDGFLRDPARLGVRTNLQSPPGPYTGGLNPPYTYPDLNHMYLAALAPSGRVVAKSFHRDWLFGTLARTNLNWTNSIGKYLTLRPRPGDHAGFPYPDDPYGDVKNLPGAPGGNDSIWIDIGAPVMTAPDGRKYKPLFAPLIVSLDGRVNVNIHGNILGDAAGNYGHRSNQGFGPWEVNLGKVLPALKGGGPAFEWQDLFRGNGSTITGKYGPNLVPSSGQTAPGALASHFYAQIDPDGREEAPPGTNGPTSRIVLPGFPGSPPGLQPWPVFPAGYGNGRPEERLNHPILFDVFKPPRYTPPNDDRVFAASEMDAVLRYGDTGSPALTSDLFRLLPRNLANAYRRRLITTVGHLDSTAPGLPPIIYNPANAPYRVDISPGQDHAAAPSGDAFVFPDPFTQRTNALPPGSEFLADWRGRKGIGYQPGVPSRERIGLTPKLPSYPHQGQGPDGGGAPLVPTYGARWDDNGVVGFAQIQEQYSMAQTARQSLADHFYRRLLKLTGVPPVSTVAPSDPGVPTNAELMPRRWLAQLAVNIVDYIDEDDICTPFNFYTAQDAQTAPGMVSPNYNPGATTGNLLSDPTMPDPQLPRYWVFGTEMPSVVVNEVLAEYKIPAGVGNTTPLPHPVKLWVELYNARTPTPPAVAGTPLQTVDGVNVPLWVPPPNGATTSTAPNAANAYGAYRLEVSTGLHKTPTGTYLNPSPLNDNVLGKPRDYVGVPTAGAVRSKAFPLIVNFGNPAGTRHSCPRAAISSRPRPTRWIPTSAIPSTPWPPPPRRFQQPRP
jgi:hypothetical protein